MGLLLCDFCFTVDHGTLSIISTVRAKGERKFLMQDSMAGNGKCKGIDRARIGNGAYSFRGANGTSKIGVGCRFTYLYLPHGPPYLSLELCTM